MISQSKIGLNFNREEGDLYASDRMAQYLGNGILLATSRRSGYQAYFGDDEMLFFDDAEELADRVGWAVSSDRRWRGMAERARANATATMSGELVTRFILDMTLGRGAPQDWKFGDQIYLRPTRKRANARPEALAPGTALVPQYS